MTMAVSVEFLPGPLTSDMSRTSAEGALQHHPAIQKGAAYALEQLEGRWVAAVIHEGGPFPPNGGGPDEEEEAPAPKSEGVPGGDESPGDGGPPSDDGGDDGGGDSESKPPHEKGEKGGVEHQLLEIVQQIAEALGLPIGLGASPVPGPDQGLVPPPAGPPHGPGGPPGMPGGPDVQKVIHDRVTKPGETPPGGTPVGAPAFASVREDHPWAHLAGKVASFEVADQIGDAPLGDIQNELKALATDIRYRVARFREDRDSDGNRVARAVITAH